MDLIKYYILLSDKGLKLQVASISLPVISVNLPVTGLSYVNSSFVLVSGHISGRKYLFGNFTFGILTVHRRPFNISVKFDPNHKSANSVIKGLLL
jgi:hypothetical protein